MIRERERESTDFDLPVSWSAACLTGAGGVEWEERKEERTERKEIQGPLQEKPTPAKSSRWMEPLRFYCTQLWILGEFCSQMRLSTKQTDLG